MERSHIKNLISTLNKLGLKYAFTGAFATSYYGYPRLSSDIDILIENNKKKLLTLCNLLADQGYDITQSDILRATEECSHFPVFHKQKTFPYFDFKIACKQDETQAIQNSTTIDYHGTKCKLVTVEDLIIKKLEWNDTKDIEIILTRHKKINIEKLQKMAKQKSVHDKLQKMLTQTKPKKTRSFHKTPPHEQKTS